MLCECALKQGVFHRYIQSVIGSWSYLTIVWILSGTHFFINHPLNNIAYGINQIK